MARRESSAVLRGSASTRSAKLKSPRLSSIFRWLACRRSPCQFYDPTSKYSPLNAWRPNSGVAVLARPRFANVLRGENEGRNLRHDLCQPFFFGALTPHVRAQAAGAGSANPQTSRAPDALFLNRENLGLRGNSPEPKRSTSSRRCWLDFT